MANKVRNLTPQGQAVRGLLTGILATRLAADAKPNVDLDRLLKGVALGKYKAQIPAIVGDVKAKFGTHLAKDADLDDLPEILEALKSAGDPDDDGDFDGISEDDDADDATPADPGAQIMQMLSSYDIPQEDLEKLNGLLNTIAPKPPAQDDDAKPNPFPGKKPGAALPEPPLTKQAMDAALKAVEKSTIVRMQNIAKAGEDVAPFIGRIDLTAADSAESVYKMALDQAGVDTKGVPASAFRAMVGLLQKPDTQKPTVAMDKASVDSYAAAYPNRPGKA